MGRWRRRSRIAAALLVVLLVAAGCSEKKKAAGRASPGDDKAGDVLRVGLERPRSLDPAQATLPSEQLIADQLFDSLTAYDPTTLEVQPSIAARWSASPDQRHWDFQLRPDAHFANGRAISSSDVKYSLERIARRGSTAAPDLAAQLEPITGYRSFRVDGKTPGLDGVKTFGPDRVRIDLDQPLASMPALLGNPGFAIVPREATEGGGGSSFAQHPTGSGPFQFQALEGNVLRLVPSAGSPARVKGIEFRLEGDVGALYAAFGRGELDWSPVPPGRVEEAAERYGRAGFRPYVIEVLYGFNLKNPKFADVRFREAIVRGIDRSAITKVVYNGTTLPLAGIVPRGIPGFQEDPCGERCRFDPERARALVAQAFVGRPVPEVAIDYDDDPTQEAIAKVMQASLAAVGIPAAVRPHPFAEYLKFASSGAQELFHFGSSGAYPTPDAFLGRLFLSGQPDNVMQFSNPAVDQLLKRGQGEPDPALRTTVYQEAERQIMAQMPLLPIGQYETHTVVSPRVRDLVVSPLGSFDASRVSLAGSG